MVKVARGNRYANVITANRGGLFWEKWHIYGEGGNDVLTGGKKDDKLDGGTGIDRLVGGRGNDLYIVDDFRDTVIEKAGEGFDTVEAYTSYTLSENIEGLQLKGSGNINGYGNSKGNLMHGNDKNNAIYGRAGADSIATYGGNDRLDGGTGADSMHGGTGSDIYVVDNVGDFVSERSGEGYDIVEARIDNYQLQNNFEALKLLATPGVTKGRGNSVGNVITGNVYDNELHGNGGNDVLKGAQGNDKLFGGTGNDRLIGMHSTGYEEVDELTGGSGRDAFQLYNFVGSNGYTYSETGYAILKDFSAFDFDRIWVLGSDSEYSLDQSRDLFGGFGNDTLIYKNGNNLVGVVEDNTYVSLERDFTFVG